MPAPRNKVSQATAYVIPVFLAAIIAYASYVLVGPLAIQYLINPPAGVPRRVAVGLAIPIAYGVLLIPVAATWLRLLLVVWRDPGYTPVGLSSDQPAQGLEDWWKLDCFVCDQRGK